MLARLRRKAESYLDDRCAIQRQIQKRTVYGGITPEWIVLATGVKCRLIKVGSQTGSAVALASEQETLTDDYRLALPAGTDIQPDDRVILDGKIIYEVIRLETRLTDEFFHMAIVRRRYGSDGD